MLKCRTCIFSLTMSGTFLTLPVAKHTFAVFQPPASIMPSAHVLGMLWWISGLLSESLWVVVLSETAADKPIPSHPSTHHLLHSSWTKCYWISYQPLQDNVLGCRHCSQPLMQHSIVEPIVLAFFFLYLPSLRAAGTRGSH